MSMSGVDVVHRFERQVRRLTVVRAVVVVAALAVGVLLRDFVPPGLEALSQIRFRRFGQEATVLEILWCAVVWLAATQVWAAAGRRFMRCPACDADPRAHGLTLSAPAVCMSCDVPLRVHIPKEFDEENPLGRVSFSAFGVVVAIGVVLFGGFLLLLALYPTP